MNRSLDVTSQVLACFNVGRTPWSARVPLDPFFGNGSSLMRHTGKPARGPAADQGVRPTLDRWASYFSLASQGGQAKACPTACFILLGAAALLLTCGCSKKPAPEEAEAPAPV